MECNKDEAFRAKKIAERKFEQKDYAGAKKFALKAQVLYPGLDDLTQMLTTFDVYISAENKVSGEVDWYGVLGVSPSSDDETVKKQYRKLALVLHPDKNKSIGAEGAFQLLSEAWSLLSDKSKRLAYNQRRSSKGPQQKQQKVPVPSGGPSTFWTICHRCKMHYEYLKIYLNHTLLCPNCHESTSQWKRERRLKGVKKVPDPDFHNFDQDRSESCFEDNEVWASYDADDGMPRFYALINKVISREPFKVRLSWLNSKTNTEFGPMEWVASGFYKTSGEFRIGRYETGKSVNSFSHKVRWSKGPRGTVLIYPQKGDVWALFRNWSADWNQNTPDDVIHKYDMVLVLDDYNEEQGISVAPLIKVAGFKTVFRPDLNPEKMIRITREEMFRFSHQVPSHLLTGEEGQNAPKGCQELDPAATPLELLQTVTETNEVPAMQNDKEANGGSSQKVQETKTSEAADHTLKSREGGMVESEGEISLGSEQMVEKVTMEQTQVNPVKTDKATKFGTET
uniref:J domain-containing protein n=1 Tax=Solanum lycopersicum TaxID=4081 RepID=A0A3Q7G2C9_SOLLC